jgi:predicted GIY-YIG superfamily endonuclease
MEKRYVYELVNLMGTVEYVGETKQPKKRFCEHVKWSRGKFYGRADIIMNIASEFDTKKEAFIHQCELQKQYGLITDSEKMIRVYSDEYRQKIGKTSKGRRKGKKHSSETIEKMSEARTKYWEMQKQNNN